MCGFVSVVVSGNTFLCLEPWDGCFLCASGRLEGLGLHKETTPGDWASYPVTARRDAKLWCNTKDFIFPYYLICQVCDELTSYVLFTQVHKLGESACVAVKQTGQ